MTDKEIIELFRKCVNNKNYKNNTKIMELIQKIYTLEAIIIELKYELSMLS